MSTWNALRAYIAKRLPWLGLLLMCFGVGNFILGRFLSFPPAEGARVFFWPHLIYDGATLYLSLILVPISIIVGSAMIFSAAKLKWLVFTPIPVAVFCCVSAFGSLMMPTFSSVDTARHAGSIYHLTVTDEVDEWPRYGLCQCDLPGIFCRCHYFYRKVRPFSVTTGSEERDNDSVSLAPHLVVDAATDRIAVQSVGLGLYYLDSDPPQCMANIELGSCVTW